MAHKRKDIPVPASCAGLGISFCCHQKTTRAVTGKNAYASNEATISLSYKGQSSK